MKLGWTGLLARFQTPVLKLASITIRHIAKSISPVNSGLCTTQEESVNDYKDPQLFTV